MGPMPTPPPAAPRRPVFVHSSFRTSSTWLWQKLRARPDTVSYYEVFNEGLGTLRAEDGGGRHDAEWDSRHPVSAPYFLEFLPLVRPGGGVAGFAADMAFEGFVPAGGPGGPLPEATAAYLRGLVEHAARGRSTAVLTSTRSLGRAGAIRRAVDAHSVLLHRNIFHQWASYSGQALCGNPYFLHTADWTLRAGRHDPFLAGLDGVFSRRRLEPDDEALFTAFALLHLYLYAHAVDAADVVVDTSALADDAGQRADAQAALSRLVGGPVDLSDARNSFDSSVVVVESRPRFVDTVEQFAKLIAATCESEKAVAFMLRLKDEMLAEWDRHDGYTRRSTLWFRRTIAELRQPAQARPAAARDGDADAARPCGTP